MAQALPGEEADPLVLRADVALYVAKKLGKKVDELTEEERKEAWNQYNNACMTDYDLLTS